MLQLDFAHYLTEYQNVKACFRAVLGYAIATKNARERMLKPHILS